MYMDTFSTIYLQKAAVSQFQNSNCIYIYIKIYFYLIKYTLMNLLKNPASFPLTKSKSHKHAVLLLCTTTNVNKMVSTLLKSNQSQK